MPLPVFLVFECGVAASCGCCTCMSAWSFCAGCARVILQCSVLSRVELLHSMSSYSALPFPKCGLPVSLPPLSWPPCYWSKLLVTWNFDAVDVSEHEQHQAADRKFFRCFSSWYISAQVVKTIFSSVWWCLLFPRLLLFTVVVMMVVFQCVLVTITFFPLFNHH